MLIAGYQLSKAEKSLLGYWLDDSWQLIEELTPSVIIDRQVYYHTDRLDRIVEFFTWMQDHLLVLGKEVDAPTRRSLINSGATKVWQIPKYNEVLIFPEMQALPNQGRAYIYTDNRFHARALRGIFQSAGYHARSDFRRVDEFCEILSAEQASLLYIDLDCVNDDVGLLLGKMKSILNGKPPLIVFVRDLYTAGPNIAFLGNQLRPFARRIFHPNEAILACLESLLLYSPDARNSLYHRSLEETLYRDFRNPRRIQHYAECGLETYRRALPFLWLYEVLSIERTGALLQKV